MQKVAISAKKLQEEIERQAFAYGMPPAVSTLLGEHVITLLQTAVTTAPSPIRLFHYGNYQHGEKTMA
ncbi:hypothetical protein HYV73_03905 [Candidatus Uhrbacteria bacterium]|nr:hypothetical protein [Candidatus Uhrbacteria bacterium]